MEPLEVTNFPYGIREIEFYNDKKELSRMKEEIKELSEKDKYFKLTRTVLYLEEAANCYSLMDYDLYKVKVTADIANLSIKPVNIYSSIYLYSFLVLMKTWINQIF